MNALDEVKPWEQAVVMPNPAEVLAVIDDAGETAPGVLDCYRCYAIAFRGAESAGQKVRELALGATGWSNSRVDEAARAVVSLNQLANSAEVYLDELRAYLAPHIRHLRWQ